MDEHKFIEVSLRNKCNIFIDILNAIKQILKQLLKMSEIDKIAILT